MKRLNVKLALWLVGIVVFSIVGVHFLHGYQVDRNADSLKRQADQAREAGNDDEAVKLYGQYLRHRDDRDAYQALAELTVEVAKDPGATRNDFIKAFNVLEEAIRRYPDMHSVRMSLIDYTIAMGRIQDAMDHIRLMKEQGSTDTRLPLREAICFLRNGEPDKARGELFKMVGYDPEAKQFAPEPPATAKEVDAFALLAENLQGPNDDPALADAVMAKLVEWNPDSAKAHLLRANHLSNMWQKGRTDTPEGQDLKTQLFGEIKDELAKATAIEPDNADVLLLTASTAMVEQDFEKSQHVLDKALKLYPKRAEVYLRRATLAQVQKDTDKAIAELKAGIKEASYPRQLLEQLVELQFLQRDLDAVSDTIDQMRKVPGIPAETIGYLDARVLIGREKLLEATRELERVRPAFERQGLAQEVAVNTLLSHCYGRLQMSDRQLEVNRRILSVQPGMLFARLGEASALQAMGRFDEAEGTVNLLAAAAKNAPAQQGEILQLVVNQELSKPVDERNWERIDELSKIVESGGQRTALQNRLLQAHLALAQGKTDEALGILGSLRKEHPKDISVWLLLCKLMSSDEKYRDRLPQLLNLADKELGPTAAIAMERIKVISRRGGEEAVEQLKKIEAGAVKFEPAQQLAVRAQLGTAYLAAGDYEDGKRCLLEVMASESSNVRIRQALLELALERQDDATVEKIMGELEKSPMFGPESTLYRYAQAASQVQKLVASRKGKTTPLTEEEHRTLADSRKLVDEAIAIRAEWAPLWRLRSDISQMEGDVNGAISDLQRSLSYSQVGQETSARKLVTLLYATQRFAEANEAMKFMGNYELPETMRRIKEAVIVKGGDPKEAIALVRKDIEKEPDNPSNYLWLGEVLEATGDAAGAEQAYRQATQKGPKLGRAWEFLVRRLMANDKREQAAQATEEAVKQLSEEPLSIARLYQRTGNLPQAEKYYLEALAKKPKDLLVMRHLAEFYLLSRDLAKSQQQLDQIIEVASNSQEPMARANLSWARTQKAQTMAPDRDYASTMEAVKLIEQNAQGGELSRPDMLAIISLLSSRMEEPDSRQKAIKLLEKMRSQSPLEVQQAVALAQLYNRQGDWQS